MATHASPVQVHARSEVLRGMEIPVASLWEVPLKGLDAVIDAWRDPRRQEERT